MVNSYTYKSTTESGHSWIINPSPNNGGYVIGDPVPNHGYISTVDPKVAQLEQQITSMRASIVSLEAQRYSMERIIKEQQEKIDRLMKAVFPTL